MSKSNTAVLQETTPAPVNRATLHSHCKSGQQSDDEFIEAVKGSGADTVTTVKQHALCTHLEGISSTDLQPSQATPCKQFPQREGQQALSCSAEKVHQVGKQAQRLSKN